MHLSVIPRPEIHASHIGADYLLQIGIRPVDPSFTRIKCYSDGLFHVLVVVGDESIVIIAWNFSAADFRDAREQKRGWLAMSCLAVAKVIKLVPSLAEAIKATIRVFTCL